MLDYLHLCFCMVFTCIVINFLQLETNALPAATTTAPPTTHIANYLNRRKPKEKYDEFPEFDFESIKGNYSKARKQSGVQELFGRLVEQFDMNMDNSIINERSAKAKTVVANNNGTSTMKPTDDSLNTKQNTLENSIDIFGNDNHHESSLSMNAANGENDTSAIWNRMKSSIAVLEPVKHLLNTVGSGALNHTIRQQPHHQLVSPNIGTNDTVIETKEDRETAVKSPSFEILDVLGSIGSIILGFFTNFLNIFQASAASSSSSSSGGSR